MQTGLLLEGGAMRGLFTAGVIDIMMEHDITYDAVLGVSAGAAFGCNYKSHQIGRAIRYNMRFARDPRYCSFLSLFLTGDLYNADFDYYRVPNEFDPFDDDTYESDPTKFIVEVTDIESGEAVFKELPSLRGQEMEWVRASASMPIAAKPVEIDGHKYMDGGLADCIPVHWFEDAGYEKQVIVLTQPEGYVKEGVRATSVLEVLLSDYPKLGDLFKNLGDIYNESLEYIAKLEREGKAFVFRPDQDLPVGKILHDPKKMELVYQDGRDNAARRVEELKEFLANGR